VRILKFRWGPHTAAPGSTELGGDRRSYGLPEQLKLVHLVGHRPNEDALDTGASEGRELFCERLGRADWQTFSEHLLWAVDGRHHQFSHHPIGVAMVTGGVKPHGGEGVGERPGILAVTGEQVLQS
jgi:hypothetical protein